MSTAAQILARIRVWSTSESSTRLTDDELRNMLNDISRRTVETYDGIWFAFTTGQTTTVANNKAAALPAPTSGGRLVRPLTVYKLSGSNRVKYNQLNYEEFAIRYLDPEADAIDDDSGPYYTLMGEEIWFGPTPTTAETIYCEGEYIPPELDGADVLTNAFTQYAPEFLLWATMRDLVLYKFEEETRLNIFEPNYRRAKNALMNASAGRDKLARRARSRAKG